MDIDHHHNYDTGENENEHENYFIKLLSTLSQNKDQDGGKEQSHEEKYRLEGISRKKVGNKFQYFYNKTGKEVTKKDLDRITKLRLPPAWINVWISTDPNDAIQAIGTDIGGKKQYKYSDTHVAEAEKNKFARLYDFIKAIPKLDRIMRQHSMLPAYDKKRVIVTMLRIVKYLHIRVGKECYAKKNKSYGISSLEKKHVKIHGNIVLFRFMGKSKKRLSYSLVKPDIKRHLQVLLKLEGKKLFQYIDENNYIKRVTDMDLNEYIQTYMGEDFTCKDFRTYAANNYFIKALLGETKKRLPVHKSTNKKNMLNAYKSTAKYLRHTRAISKKSYVMNFVTMKYQNEPEYFIERKNDPPTEVLMDLLTLYRKKVLKIK